MVEHTTENRGVASSNLALAIPLVERRSECAVRRNLPVADRFAELLLHDPSLDIHARQPILHLGARERLAVPVAGYLRIRVPRDEAIDVAGVGEPQGRQSSVYEKSQWRVIRAVAAPALR